MPGAYACQFQGCTYVLSSEAERRQHVQTFHLVGSLRALQIKCDQCPFTCTDGQTMNSHLTRCPPNQCYYVMPSAGALANLKQLVAQAGFTFDDRSPTDHNSFYYAIAQQMALAGMARETPLQLRRDLVRQVRIRQLQLAVNAPSINPMAIIRDADIMVFTHNPATISIDPNERTNRGLLFRVNGAARVFNLGHIYDNDQHYFYSLKAMTAPTKLVLVIAPPRGAGTLQQPEATVRPAQPRGTTGTATTTVQQTTTATQVKQTPHVTMTTTTTQHATTSTQVKRKAESASTTTEQQATTSTTTTSTYVPITVAGGTFRCTGCKLSLKTYEALLTHHSSMHNPPVPNRCRICRNVNWYRDITNAELCGTCVPPRSQVALPPITTTTQPNVSAAPVPGMTQATTDKPSIEAFRALEILCYGYSLQITNYPTLSDTRAFYTAVSHQQSLAGGPASTPKNLQEIVENFISFKRNLKPQLPNDISQRFRETAEMLKCNLKVFTRSHQSISNRTDELCICGLIFLGEARGNNLPIFNIGHIYENARHYFYSLSRTAARSMPSAAAGSGAPTQPPVKRSRIRDLGMQPSE